VTAPTREDVGPDQPAAFVAVAPASGTTSRLNVFVSYSRDDRDFADQLVAGLEALGFPTTIDRRGIHGAENWKQRLGELILGSDIVVFVLTPTSATSPVCQWEVDHARELKKRIVPVLARPLGDARPHEYLQDLNYIHFYPEPTVPGSGFGTGLGRLGAALSLDVEWTREHTRLGSLAARWQGGNRPPDLLVRGTELADWQRWRTGRPSNAPELTILQRAFLQASEDAEATRTAEEHARIEERQQALRQAEQAQAERAIALKKFSRLTRYGFIGVVVLGAVVTVWAFVTYQQHQALKEARLRLREGMVLKIAQTDHIVHATEKWYRIATDYKLAIGTYRTQSSATMDVPLIGSGFLVKGDSLRSEWRDQVVFLTASHVIHGGNQNSEPDFAHASVTFPGIAGGTPSKVAGVLFDSSRLDVAVLELSGGLPPHAVPVALASQIEWKEKLDGIAVLHWTAEDGFSLGLGHGLDPPSEDSDRPDRMYFTFMTGPGASGAPVFDTSSGNVVCLHQGAGAGHPRRRYGYCTSIAKVVAAIASNQP
jgi:hypothetical protein